MKAVIPVAGVGSRLRPHTHTQPKPLIPIAGKPILAHIIDSLVDAGINEVVFIVGYLKEKIQEYIISNYAEKLQIEFVVQEPRRGLAHAIWVSKDLFSQNDEMLIVLGDTIFDDDINTILETDGSVLGVQEVDDPRDFGVAVLDDRNNVIRLIEKPQIPTSNLALVGIYKIQEGRLLFRVLDEMIRHDVVSNGEFVFTDALMTMLRHGVKFQAHVVENWFDCGKKQTLLDANQILLERIEEFPDYDYHNSVIIPPVNIAAGCEIVNSIVGPHVAIGENSHIRNSIVKNSIVGAYSTLESIILKSSIVGSDASLHGRANSVSIGDSTQIDFEE